jgi:ribosomal protein L7/L12
MEPALEAAIAEALVRGEKIKAIALYREAAHVGLAEAKAAVESWAATGAPPRPSGEAISPASLDAEIEKMLRRGDPLVRVVVHVRQATGCSLRDAMDSCYGIAERAGLAAYRRPGPLKAAIVLAAIALPVAALIWFVLYGR